MKIKGKINLLGATESGVSKATGNPWKCKDVVIEFEDGGVVNNTMALRTFNDECITKLDACVEGDEIEADVYFRADYREYKRQDGTTAIARSTNCSIRDIEVTEQKGF